jgi:hypothetical protein
MGKRDGKKIIETLGYVVVAQVPMIMTFEENKAAFIISHLGDSLEKAYDIIEMFGVH